MSETPVIAETAEKTRVSQVAANGATAKDVRAWAVANGVEVGTRGRLSSEVLEAFNAANPA